MTAGQLDIRMQPWREPRGGSRMTSVWMEEAVAAEAGFAAHVLQGDLAADVCIVGGGFTGLWTALRLLEQSPGLNIVIVEAGLCGCGASGRNSGAMGHWWARLPTLVRLVGQEDAVRLLNASVNILTETRQYVADNGIDCDLRLEPSVWSSNFPNQPGAWLPMMRMAGKLGIEPPHRELSATELNAMYGDAPYYSGVVEEDSIRLNPAALARGLRRLAISRGVRVFESSPVLSAGSGASGVDVRTEQGKVRAAKVLFAANAWMAHLPELKPFITVVSSEIVVTDPIPELLEKLGTRRRPGGVNSRLMLNYGGITPQGRVYLGRGGGSISFGNRIDRRFDRSDAMSAEVEADFRYLYPELANVPIARSWAGPIDRSAAGLPWFGQLAADARAHYAIGYSGHGVGAAALGGRILAAQLLEQKNEWSALGELFRRARQGWYPPEPIRYWAAKVIRAGVARKELAQREGRTPSALNDKLASFAMSSLPDRWR